MGTGRSRFAKLAGVALFSLAAALVVAELMTRWWADVAPPVRERDPEIGNRYRKNFADVLFVEEVGRRVALRFNSEGFRGPTRPRQAPPGTCRIAIIGDSQIAAIGTDEEDTMVGRLEARLRAERPSERWEVHNFGVSGASTVQELALYRKVVRAYAPDVVVLAFYEGNDFSDNWPEFSTSPRIYMDLVDGRLVERPMSEEQNHLTTWLNRYSRFYVWQKQRVRRATQNVRDAGRFLGPSGGLLTYWTEPREDLAGAWALLERALVELSSAVQDDGHHFVLLVIPDGMRLHPELWASRTAGFENLDPSLPSRRLARMTTDHGIPTFSLEPAFLGAIDGRPASDESGWLYYGATGHLNVRGNDLAAERVLGFLRDSGALEDCPPD